MIDKRIGFIGVGNMGSAILQGMLEKRIADMNAVVIYDTFKEKLDEFSEKWNVIHADSVPNLVDLSDVVFLAVKPQDFLATAGEMKQSMSKDKIIISILAGMTVDKLKDSFEEGVSIVRAMPNFGASVGQAVTALTSSDKKALEMAKTMFGGCGQVVELDESKFDLITAISGSGPAYFFYLMECMVKEAVLEGISEKEARMLAVQTAVGAGLLAQTSGFSPQELKERVTSKGGTTEAALNFLKDNQFESNFHSAIQAAMKRGEELRTS